MKSYYKQCKNTKQVNAFLKKIGLGEFEFDADYDFSRDNAEFDFDAWVDAEETKGVNLQIHPSYEVFATKYTKADIDRMNREVA